MDNTLKATPAIQSDHPRIRALAAELCTGLDSPQDQAKALFAFVRDRITYNIYMVSMHPDDFRASFILDAGKGYCVQKAVLLCALSRATGIPCRLALAEIRNFRVPAALRQRIGRDVFPGHAYNQFFLDGRWISAAATFHRDLCRQVGAPVVDFDGNHDALLPARALDGGPYIEYVQHLGAFDDLPLDFITRRTSRIWGADKRAWLRPEDDTGFP